MNPKRPPQSGAGAVEGPFCSELRSKKFYFLAAPAARADDLTDASEHFWCRRTQQAVGPDHFPVHATECRSGRPCFRALFRSPT